MAGSAEEAGAPDSWELADLEESVSRLMVSSSSKDRDLGFVEDPPAGTDDSLLFSGPSPPVPAGTRVVPEELVSQVDQFLREALEKPRERISILRMEQDVEKFIRDPTQQQIEFQALPTSYLRLAAHRVAQHYYLQSVAVPDNSLPDGSGSRIVLFKTSECRFPPVRLADIPVNLPQEDGNNNVVKVAIKQRPQKWSQAINNAANYSSKENYLKSVEERKEEYNRARARIFSGNSSTSVRLGSEPNLPDNLQQHCALASVQIEVKPIGEVPDVSVVGRRLGESSTTCSRAGKGRIEKEPVVNRHKASNRVAIFRDREVDRKDPDYDRSYDRYMQRFDPGFGFAGGSFPIQPMYSPAINYNTEFPQLGTNHRPQISVDPQSRQMVQHMHPAWGTICSPTAVGYGSPDGMMTSFHTNHVAPQSTSLYLRSPQYVPSPRPGMPFVHHEHVQPFAQTQQQPEASFGLARPR